MFTRRISLIAACALALNQGPTFAADPSTAASPSPAEEPASPTPNVASPTPSVSGKSTSVTINLINRMVEKGLLSKEDSADLIKQAEADAAIAREQTEAVQAAVQQIASVQSIPTDSYATPPQLDPSVNPSMPQQELPAPYPGPDDTMRVSYIPESVKDEMREQIKADVLAQAREENWSSPRMLPDWVTRFRLFVDVRVRYQGDYFSSGNDNTGAFPNFNAINTGAPFDVSGTVFSPQLNVDQNRNRTRLRLRFGAEVTLRDNFSVGFRIASGSDNSPVTTNQTLGGSGGNFSKYQIWLDRAFIRYDFTGIENFNAAFFAGRFENPFFSSPVIWDEDVGFDGFALKANYKIEGSPVTPFMSAGAFPVFNTDFNYATNQSAKFKSQDKWLYAAQVGIDWKILKDLTAKFAAAYYRFDNVEGKLSDPFTPLTASDQGNTDATRPSFAQKGNTYFAIRNIVPNASNNFGTTNQFQYFGLASKFTDVALTGKLDYGHFEPFHVVLTGEWIKNTAFNEQDIAAKAVNNRGPASTGVGQFAGGDTAWIVNLRLGHPTLENRGDWAIDLGYRYVESDAVIDGFTESDFGGGGTNLKGYSFGGVVALSPDVTLGLRWMSANEIAGPPLKSDVLLIDLNSKF